MLSDTHVKKSGCWWPKWPKTTSFLICNLDISPPTSVTNSNVTKIFWTVFSEPVLCSHATLSNTGNSIPRLRHCFQLMFNSTMHLLQCCWFQKIWIYYWSCTYFHSLLKNFKIWNLLWLKIQSWFMTSTLVQLFHSHTNYRAKILYLKITYWINNCTVSNRGDWRSGDSYVYFIHSMAL